MCRNPLVPRRRVRNVLLACAAFAAPALAHDRSSVQVNATEGLGLEQTEPALASTPNGGSVAVWVDERNGTPDLRYRLFGANGLPLGSSAQVNDDPLRRAMEGAPRVAVDGTGSFVVTWHDDRAGHSDVYVRRFNSLGQPVGSSLLVNDDGLDASQTNPDVACDANGAFIVVWEDDRVDASIYAQRFDANGAPLGANFPVNVPVDFAFTSRPAVSMSPTGSFTIAWIDVDLYFPEIFARAYAGDGTPLTAPLWISDDGTNMDHQRPAVATSDDSHTVITWSDAREGSYGIHAQLLGSAGSLVGTNFRVDGGLGGVYDMEPVVAMTTSGALAIAWNDYVDGQRSIYAQWFTADGTPIGSNTTVAVPESPTVYYRPAITVDGQERATIAWELIRYQAPRQYDVMARRYDGSGAPLDNPIVINDDVAACHQLNPEVAANTAGASAVVWEDMRDGNPDVYVKRYGADGLPFGDEELVNDDGTDIHQRSPNVAVGEGGESVVAWIDGRVSYTDVFFQLYDAAGDPVGVNAKVNEGTEGSQYGIKLAMDPTGGFVVVWADSRIDFYDVFLQRYAADGTPLGGNLRVNTDDAGRAQSSPDVAMDGDGSFIVVWSQNDGIAYGWRMYAQRFDALGNRLGSIFQVDDGSGAPSYRRSSVVAMNANGEFAVAWRDQRSGDDEIYARLFDASGIALGGDFAVTAVGDGMLRETPEVAMGPAGGLAVLWTDYRTGYPQLHVRRYASGGEVVGADTRVGTDLPVAMQHGSSAAFAGARLNVVWRGNHFSDQGYDIWLASHPAAPPTDGGRRSSVAPILRGVTAR